MSFEKIWLRKETFKASRRKDTSSNGGRVKGASEVSLRRKRVRWGGRGNATRGGAEAGKKISNNV